MSSAVPPQSKDDVLDAFAVEQTHDRRTLERYLQDYPQFARELVDLSRELARLPYKDDSPLSHKDQATIDTAWQRHAEAIAENVFDPFANLSTSELRDIASKLAVPRQVVTAFRERRVILSTVPKAFRKRLAEAINCTVEAVVAALSVPTNFALARSYKADHKPGADEAVSFERVLIDAGVDDVVRARLLSEDE